MVSNLRDASYFRVVLVEPEIPNNTGNIGRTCVGTNSKLELIGPLGFSMGDRYLKRAGLDYWPHLQWEHHPSWEQWSQDQDLSRALFFSTKGKHSLFDARFRKGDLLIFGKETKGLGSEILDHYRDQTYFIPMFGPIRSLNLANTVSTVLYEGLRQIGVKPQDSLPPENGSFSTTM